MTIAEWAATDMQWWNEMAQAISAWRNGQTAGGQAVEAKAETHKPPG